MKSTFILPLLTAMLLTANARASEADGIYVFDASGADGLPGAIDPAKAGKDPNNGAGEPGHGGGYIDLEIGFVPDTDSKMIYIKGFRMVPAKGQKPTPIQERIVASSLKEIRIVARGGNGGIGGSGPNGLNGSKSPKTAAQPGANGAPGGAGGNGGYVNVRFGEGAESLLSLVHVNAAVGRRGEGGLGGNGGMGVDGTPAADGADGATGKPGLAGAVYFLNIHSRPITKAAPTPKDSAEVAGKLNGMLNSGNSDLGPREGNVAGQRHPSAQKHDSGHPDSGSLEDARGTEDAHTRSDAATVK
ncbi:MAG: hypothetical protein ACXWR1_14960 [Bdellovibrionota bacterium]